MELQKNPSKKMYGLAAVLLFIGIALSVAFILQFISNSKEDLRFVAPGIKEFTVDKAGSYTIFYEHKSDFKGKIYNTGENISGLMVLIQDKATETPVKLTNTTNSSYNINGREGVSIFKFKLKEPGDYEILAAYENIEGPEIVLSIKEGFAQSLTLAIVGTIIGGFVTLTSIILFIITYLKRKK